jgi:hypothetical protein
MSAKTCLHCGKTLVFIRVGAGGDFCSREHRNQYQLRRGMDCLAEANKVATLARRRETPKALFGEAVAGSSSAPPRSFSSPAPLGLLAGLSPAFRRTNRTGPVALLPRAEAFRALIPHAAPIAVRRELAVKFSAPRVGAPSRGSRPRWKPSSLAGKAVRGLRALAVSAAPGNALRVSASAAFHLKAPSSRKFDPGARYTRAGAAAFGAPATSLPFALRQERPGAPPDNRFAFIDMGFSTAPDAPARIAWLHAGRTPVAVPEQRES